MGGCLSACETLPNRDNSLQREIESASQQRIYYASFEAVWRSAQIALRYPMALTNMDNGELETDWIRALDGFIPPGPRRNISAGMLYKLRLSLVRGKANGRPSVRVTIRKQLKRNSDFFSEEEYLLSDGIEERVILYRIEREIILFDLLRTIQPS